MEIRYPRLKDSSMLDEWDDEAIDDLVAEFAALPCPALQSDGSCGIYESRPMTCRTMGLPVEEQGLVQGACEIQTFVPIKRLSSSIREQEQELAHQEAVALDQLREQRQARGEEILLAYGFLGMNQ
jgi:Fe-S-cluster containining protein